MCSGAQKHTDVPDEMHAVVIFGERNHAGRVEYATAQNGDEQPPCLMEHARNKKKSAPSDEEVQCDVKWHHTGRAKECDDSNSKNDNAPLNTEHHDALGIAPIYKT